MSSTRLPQELVDQIIDALQDDKRTLATCSLTCQSWVPRSSRYLLRHVRLQAGDIQPFGVSLRTSTRLSRYTSELHAPCKPGLADLVQSIPRLECLSVETARGPDHVDLEPAAGRNLRQLRLRCLSEYMTGPLLDAFDTIKTLIFEDCSFDGRAFPVTVEELIVQSSMGMREV